MADVVVEAEIDEQGRSVACAKISADELEFNVRATPAEFAALRATRTADWAARGSIAMGMSAGAPVFWASDGRNALILIGQDDETWDVAISVPVEVVDRLADLVRDL